MDIKVINISNLHPLWPSLRAAALLLVCSPRQTSRHSVGSRHLCRSHGRCYRCPWWPLEFWQHIFELTNLLIISLWNVWWCAAPQSGPHFHFPRWFRWGESPIPAFPKGKESYPNTFARGGLVNCPFCERVKYQLRVTPSANRNSYRVAAACGNLEHENRANLRQMERVLSSCVNL